MLSKETYESQLPDCEPGEELTITIESPTSTVTMTGTVQSAKDGGLEIPLVAGEPEVEEEVEAPKPKAAVSKAVKAAVEDGY